MAASPERHSSEARTEVEEDILRPLGYLGTGFWWLVLVLGTIFAWGLFAWVHQIRNGLGVTGLNCPVFWGVYITNFVFFIGISHAGTLISSILRICQVEWRRPFTRAAEAVTVFSLPFGAMSVIVDLGRPDRLFNVIKHPHFTSPILWDVCCISTYLLTSCVYFYLALIPDIAVCRDRLTRTSPFRRWLYRTLAAGWTGTERQWKILDGVLAGMCIFLFVLVVSVHTNVSFVFGMTLKPGWHTTVIGPYFVCGAIFSGVATVIIVMAILRKLFHLEDYVTDWHFDRLGAFLLALTCFWFYFTFVEYLTTFYGHEIAEMQVFNAKFFQEYSFPFWLTFVCCFVLPLPILAVRRWRTIPNLVIVSIIINIGMWFERYTIIVPSAARPILPYGWGSYFPSWVELSVTAGWFAGFSLLLVIFSKVFPVLTIWEVLEGRRFVPRPQ